MIISNLNYLEDIFDSHTISGGGKYLRKLDFIKRKAALKAKVAKAKAAAKARVPKDRKSSYISVSVDTGSEREVSISVDSDDE